MLCGIPKLDQHLPLDGGGWEGVLGAPIHTGQPPPTLDPSHLKSLHRSDFALGRFEARKGEGVDCLSDAHERETHGFPRCSLSA